jgi:hypothetical protein
VWRYSAKLSLILSFTGDYMKKFILIFTAIMAFFLAGCATKSDSLFATNVGSTFNEYGKGQLVIFSVIKPDSKLRFGGEVECNGVLCARMVLGTSPNGVYSVHSFTPRDVVIKAPGKKFIPFAGSVELNSNSLTAKIEPGKRTVVMVTLVGGREIQSSTGQVGNATQIYQIDSISEADALPKIKGLTELKFKEALQ